MKNIHDIVPIYIYSESRRLKKQSYMRFSNDRKKTGWITPGVETGVAEENFSSISGSN